MKSLFTVIVPNYRWKNNVTPSPAEMALKAILRAKADWQFWLPLLLIW